jgi:hypothetical protein
LAPFITQHEGSMMSPAIVFTPSLPDEGEPLAEEAEALAGVADLPAVVVVVFVAVPAVWATAAATATITSNAVTKSAVLDRRIPCLP